MTYACMTHTTLPRTEYVEQISIKLYTQMTQPWQLEVVGWVQPGNCFVLFRSFVRACARSGCLVDFGLQRPRRDLTFFAWSRRLSSLFFGVRWGVIPFNLLESKWIGRESKLIRTEIEVNSWIRNEIYVNKWHRSVIDVKLKWNRSETEVKPTWNRS